MERLEILSKTPFAPGTEFGQVGAYEKLRGRAWFALDPDAASNAAIADLKLAPRNNRGLVIFNAEFLVLRPVDAARGNGTLLYEVNNRGNIGILRQLNGATTGSNDPATAADAGNGFLLRKGFTLVWSAWATDVATTPGDKRMVLDRLAARLAEFKDPRTGETVVERVYFPEEVFQGRNLKYSPDLLVGFRRGYRASWQTALGSVPAQVLEDNTQAWIGDHCMASDQVPGVLFSNRPIRADAPHLWDITASILGEFGVPKANGMIGQSVF